MQTVALTHTHTTHAQPQKILINQEKIGYSQLVAPKIFESEPKKRKLRSGRAEEEEEDQNDVQFTKTLGIELPGDEDDSDDDEDDRHHQERAEKLKWKLKETKRNIPETLPDAPKLETAKVEKAKVRRLFSFFFF